MDLVWVFVFLFLPRGEAENVTEVRAVLGQNITLPCSLADTDIYWYMQVHSSIRSCILRTFGRHSVDVYTSAPTDKFSPAPGNGLLISNVTADDVRPYYCARKQTGELQFVKTSRLVLDAPPSDAPPSDAPPSGTPPSVAPPSGAPTLSPQNDCQSKVTLWRPGWTELILYASLALNALLLMVLASLCLKKRTCERTDGDPSVNRPENLEEVESPQYEEIQLSDRAPPAGFGQDGIYSKAGFPQSMPPPQTHLDRY